MENNYRKTPKRQNNLGIRPLSVEEVLQGKAKGEIGGFRAIFCRKMTPERKVGHGKTVDARSSGVIDGRPSFRLTAGRGREVHPRIFPRNRRGKSVQGRVGQLVVVVGCLFHRSIHRPIADLRPAAHIPSPRWDRDRPAPRAHRPRLRDGPPRQSG